MMAYGIEALNFYVGQARIDAVSLACGRGLDSNRLENIQQLERSVGLGFEDPVTNAVNAAIPIVKGLGRAAEAIEMVIISTESGIDYSKSIASYAHRYLELSSRCRFMEVKQACYAATGMLQLSIGYLCSGLSPGAKILLIATDVALVDERAGFSEISTGFGAVAILISDTPNLLQIDLGAFGLHSYETADSARPTPTMDIADIDRSLFAYLDCLSCSFKHYSERVADADFAHSHAYLAMHTPFPGIVKAGHRKMMRELGQGAGVAAIEQDFASRVGPSLELPRRVGNLCSGSLYLALASLIATRTDQAAARVGLFSYGSGCSSEFFSGIIRPGANRVMGIINPIAELDKRTLLDFKSYLDILDSTKNVLVPKSDYKIDKGRFLDFLSDKRDPMLVLSGCAGYYREYDWI